MWTERSSWTEADELTAILTAGRRTSIKNQTSNLKNERGICRSRPYGREHGASVEGSTISYHRCLRHKPCESDVYCGRTWLRSGPGFVGSYSGIRRDFYGRDR